MKNLIFSAVFAACSLIFSLSGSAQTVIKSFPLENEVKLLKSPHDGAILVEYKSAVDSTIISRVDKKNITPFVHKKGYPHLIGFHIMQDGDLMGAIGDTLYKFWISGAPEIKLLSGKNILPLSIRGLRMILCVSDGFNQHIINYDWVNKVVIDTLEVAQASGGPFIRHYGGVGDYFYYSVSNWPESSTIKRYRWYDGYSEVISYNGLVQQYGNYSNITHSSEAKFVYAVMERDSIFATFISLDTTIVKYFQPKEEYGDLSFVHGPDRELVGIITDKSIVFVGDSISSWNYPYDPVSSNWGWSGRYILNEWDGIKSNQHLNIFIGKDKFTIFKVVGRYPIQQSIETYNIVYGLQGNIDHYELWYYNLCGNDHLLQGVTNETSYKAGKAWKSHQKVEGSVLYEPSGSLLLLPGFEADASQGDIFEARIWTEGCPNN